MVIKMKELDQTELKFEKDVTVEQADCDVNNILKIGAVMRYVQQISIDHCDILGIDDKRYKETSTAFLLAKMSVEMYEAVPVGTKLHLVTTPFAAVRAVYNRYTHLLNEEGREVAAVDARWILVDTSTRKILRHPPEALQLPFSKEPDVSQSVSIPKVKETEPAGTYQVHYSQADLNHHLNNTIYADIVCDMLPLELMTQKRIKKMVVDYRQEVLLGQTMELQIRELPEEQGWYCSGMLHEKKTFEAWTQFEE